MIGTTNGSMILFSSTDAVWSNLYELDILVFTIIVYLILFKRLRKALNLDHVQALIQEWIEFNLKLEYNKSNRFFRFTISICLSLWLKTFDLKAVMKSITKYTNKSIRLYNEPLPVELFNSFFSYDYLWLNLSKAQNKDFTNYNDFTSNNKFMLDISHSSNSSQMPLRNERKWLENFFSAISLP